MSSLIEDLDDIKDVEDGLVGNKVANFAYEDSAYTNNQVNGVDDYNVNRAQNIPNASASILKVNATILAKGLRAQASSITRMLVNHFFGRVSYNLNKIHDNFNSFLTSLRGYIGQPNGIASLDADGRIPYSQLPESALEWKGEWDASTNTPHLADGTGTTGDMYIVTVAGVQDLGSGDISFLVNDRVIYNGTVWQKFAGGDVKTVSEIPPDSNGNIDLSLQTDVTKVLAPNIIAMLFKGILGKSWSFGKSKYNIPLGGEGVVHYANGMWVCGGETIMYKAPLLSWSEDGLHWTPANIWSSTSGGQVNVVTYADGIWLAGGNNLLGSGICLLWSEDGKTWHVPSVAPDTVIATIAYSGSIWVATGSSTSSNKIWYSTDGKTWTACTGTGTDKRYYSCVYADGLFVIAGTWNGIMWSTDGMSWAQTNITASSDAYIVKYANGVWVCSSTSATGGGLWSEDGKTWSPCVLETGLTGITRVAYGGGIWAGTGSNSSSDKVLCWSEDGENWYLRETQPAMSALRAITYWKDRFICCGDASGGGTSQTVLYSTDGKNWSTMSLPSEVEFHFTAKTQRLAEERLSGNNALLCIAGDQDDSIGGFYTADGENIQAMPCSTIDFLPKADVSSYNDLNERTQIIDKSKNIILAYNFGYLMYSEDNGENWHLPKLEASNSYTIFHYLHSFISEAGGRFFLVGNANCGNTASLYTSTDGKTWKLCSGYSTNISGSSIVYYSYEAGYDGTQWIIGGGDGLYTSTDGENWTHISSQANKPFTGVLYANGIWIAICTSSSSSDKGLYSSSDGVTWTKRQAPNASANQFIAVYSATGYFVAVEKQVTTSQGSLWYSANGTSWTRKLGAGVSSLVYANNVWLGIFTVSSQTKAYYSNDGQTWTDVYSDANYTPKYISYAFGNYIISATKAGITSFLLLYSSDLSNWRNAQIDYDTEVDYDFTEFPIGSSQSLQVTPFCVGKNKVFALTSLGNVYSDFTNADFDEE